MGGGCILVYTSCTFLDQSWQIAEHIHSIWQHAKVLPEVTKDIASWSKHLWETIILAALSDLANTMFCMKFRNFNTNL